MDSSTAILVRPTGRENRAAANERFNATLRELAGEAGRHGLTQHPRFTARRDVENSTVLDDDDREGVQIGANGHQLFERPPRDRYCPPTGHPESLERARHIGAQVPGRRDRSVVIRRER